MKTPLIVILVCCAALAQASEPKAPAKATLFIGNSITDYNQMPAMVAHFFASRKLSMATAQHPAGADVVKPIAARRWTFVVVQDHSRGPVAGDEYAKTRANLCRHIRKSGAVPVVFITWGYWGRPTKEVSKLTAEQHAAVYTKYCDSARSPETLVAPVGAAWQMAIDRDPKTPMHIQGDVHPTAEASYLAACVLYSVMSGQSPLGLPATLGTNDQKLVELTAARAKFLQQVADDAIARFSPKDPPPQERNSP